MHVTLIDFHVSSIADNRFVPEFLRSRSFFPIHECSFFSISMVISIHRIRSKLRFPNAICFCWLPPKKRKKHTQHLWMIGFCANQNTTIVSSIFATLIAHYFDFSGLTVPICRNPSQWNCCKRFQFDSSVSIEEKIDSMIESMVSFANRKQN